MDQELTPLLCWLQKLAELLRGLSLETLGFRGCLLEDLPDAVTVHTSLRRLVIRDCSLTALPLGPYLRRLQHLDLRGNLLNPVPPAALHAPDLETVALLGAR